MATGYLHVEVEIVQSSRRPGAICGDVVACDRQPRGTTVACADGIGSGIKAHIAAQLCTSRLMELLRQGFSLRRAFASVVETVEQWRDPARPWAPFSVARVRSDGAATILCYDSPGPVLVSRHMATPLPAHPLHLGKALVSESHCHLATGEGVLLVTDGVTQAGMGCGLPLGWQLEGAAAFMTSCLGRGIAVRAIPHHVHREARRLAARGGDDCTAILAFTKSGLTVNLFTGPPGDRRHDEEAVTAFMRSEGLKIVCGGTTAELVARALGAPVTVEQNATSLMTPPRYEIDQIDLVTEGAVTLTQVYNVLDEDTSVLKEDSGVTDLCAFLNVADRVNLFVGTAHNRAGDDVSFRQRGILTRKQIVPLLAKRLRDMGKMVVVKSW